MSTRTLNLEITEEDIARARRKSTSPVCEALERCEGSQWRSVGCIMLVEVWAPFRLVFVSAELEPYLSRFERSGKMEPLTVPVLMQQRNHLTRFREVNELQNTSKS